MCGSWRWADRPCHPIRPSRARSRPVAKSRNTRIFSGSVPRAACSRLTGTGTGWKPVRIGFTSPRCKGLRALIEEQSCGADALARRADRGCGGGHAQAGRHGQFDGPRPVGPPEGPDRPRDERIEGDTGEGRQIFRALGRAEARQQGWARAHHRWHGTHAGRDHAAVRQGADPHGHVDVILDQVKVAVREKKPDRDVGVGARNAVTMGRTCSSPNRTGAVMTSSPRGFSNSPDALRSASSISRRMRRRRPHRRRRHRSAPACASCAPAIAHRDAPQAPAASG